MIFNLYIGQIGCVNISLDKVSRLLVFVLLTTFVYIDIYMKDKKNEKEKEKEGKKEDPNEKEGKERGGKKQHVFMNTYMCVRRPYKIIVT